ncbi:hypothetical protein EIP86_007456 [Pleurotus ostreatoroseus]|nr:hypothetical protein EIP86_007456 [Pleurotus ostreatoroseus]
MNDENTLQFAAFKDCLARRIIAKSDSGIDDPSELDDFTLYLASEVWLGLPEPLRTASYATRTHTPSIDSLLLDSTPTSFADTLTSCGLAADTDDALALLRKTLEDYIADVCAPPPVWSSTRTTECEMCERAVPLTYHHLIPREMHAKVLKKKWHPEEMLNSVAWLCRPCHSTVHRVTSNEDLARNFYTLDLLLEREDIQRWRAYAAKQRWGVKRG